MKRNDSIVEGSQKNQKSYQINIEPLEYRFKFMSNSTLRLKFNQNILIPDFEELRQNISNKQLNKRILLKMSEINVPRDMLEMKYDLQNEAAANNFSFSVELFNWESDQIFFKFNFSKPLAVSQGTFNDKLIIKIKDSSQFIGKYLG